MQLVMLLATACQPTLWGTQLPPPTFIVPAITKTVIPSPTTAPTATPVPEVLWIGPSVPAPLRDSAQALGWREARTKEEATIFLDLADSDSSKITWIYALVVPFPTVTDNITRNDFKAAWNGSSSGPLGGLPLLMDESTLAALTAALGAPGAGVAKIVPSGELLDHAWNEMPSWAVIPFDEIEPRWKVIAIDEQSPVRKNFDIKAYPLVANFGLVSDLPISATDLPLTNRDPSRLTTVVLTGVTAMVRATAKTMDVRGITFPGQDIREMLREADITHINNEVPFYGGCPDPDPEQTNLIFCSAPRYIQLLTDIGTDVVELSGDHFANYGERGMLETLDIYREHQIPYYGGGANLQEGRKPLLREVNGTKLMFIGCNIKSIYATATDEKPGAVPCDLPYMEDQIGLYRDQGYLPIVTFQYHEYDTPQARPEQQADFRRMAEAGAVVVSGSQAHVPQTMEFHSGAFIHYGLGNLFFDQMQAVGGSKTKRREFIDRHVFYDGRYIGVELFTTYLEDFSRPRYMTREERAAFLFNYFELSGWVPGP